MAIDARYQDNVVLKQDAFQNLLTNIKNYPIIDIDYISEIDTDQLHGDTVWDHYTEGVPCIKITYGDERTTKGNIMFAEQYKNEIATKQNILKHLQTILDELTKRKSRWEAVYEENHAIYQEKDNQVQRFIANFEEIKSNKLAFLMAGWNLLYINLPINIDDPYEVVPADATNINQYNPNVIYYTHSKEYMFKRYEFKDGVEFIDVYTGIKPGNSLYNTMRNDWVEKVANQEIYTKKSGPISPDALLLQQELGPQLFSYENILIKKNPYILIQRGTAYDSNATYYVHNSSNGEFSTYINNHVSSSDPSYTQKIEDWNQKVLAKVIYIKTTEDDPQRVFNLTYTSLGSSKADVLSILQQAKNRVDGQGNSIWKTNPDEQEVFDNFIEFIMAYNKLVFLDTIGIAGYSANDIEDLKRENPDLVTMVQRLTEDGGSSDFDWEAAEEYWNANLLSYYNTFYQRIAGIVDTIKDVINNNLIYIRNQIRDANASIVEYTELVNIAQRDLDALWERINSEAVYEYVPVPEGAVYNRAREYFTYNSNTEEYVPYTYTTAANWENSITKYVKNDRTVYGYKYVRVGSNIEFSDTYVSANAPYTSPTSALEKHNTPDNQASGTFRITINKHIYEVPIKGFGAESNQPITLSTSSILDIHSKGNTTIQAKNNRGVLQTITLDGNVEATGTFTAGNNSTINGNLTVNGAVGISSTLGVAGETTLQSTITTGTANGGANIIPGKNETGTLGTSEVKWLAVYAKNLYGNLNGAASTAAGDEDGNNIKANYAANLSYNNGSLQLLNKNGVAIGNAVSITTNTAGATNNASKLFLIGAASQSASIQTYSYSDTYMTGGTLHSTKVENAIFNDYAEYRTTIDLSPGHIVIDNDDGTLSCATQRLQPGAQVISDTFGSSMGETDYAKTPLAVAGRVLVYTYQDRYKYHAGMAVCSAPNGTVDIMTRKEIRDYPDCIVGIVSEIPEYEEWGTDKVKVNDRIWIKVK